MVLSIRRLGTYWMVLSTQGDLVPNGWCRSHKKTWNLMDGAEHRETWYLLVGAEHIGILGT